MALLYIRQMNRGNSCNDLGHDDSTIYIVVVIIIIIMARYSLCAESAVKHQANKQWINACHWSWPGFGDGVL